MTSLALQPETLAPALLERRDVLNVDTATTYLAGRLRALTPMGASEYLELKTQYQPGTYDQRLAVAVEVCDLYRQMFPAQYNLSGAPLYSLAREQELYLLLDRYCFPLAAGLEQSIREHPTFFLPQIIITGQQTHDWRQHHYRPAELETVYKLAQVLSERAGGYGWAGLANEFNLPGTLAPPFAVVGWELFRYSCAVDESPLQFFPLAFHVTNYSTGCVWLDLPPGQPTALDWSGANVARLVMQRRKAAEIFIQIGVLDDWLNEAPRERIAHAVELWNKAAAVEASSRYAGLLAGPGEYMFIPEMPQLVGQMEGQA